DLCVSIFYHLADSKERAIREITPFYEEHVKMFGPLGFVPGITPAQLAASTTRRGRGARRVFGPGTTPAQLAASTKRSGWGAAGVPTVEHYMKSGAWFAGRPEELT